MKILPVIDIRNGIAVRGVAGQRDSYRPVESRLTSSHSVVEIAEAIRSQFAINDFYIADLDAILDDAPNFDLFLHLADRDFQLTVDAGLREEHRAEMLLENRATTVIAGLETISGPALLGQLCRRFGPNRVLFSLDLQNGRPLFAENSQSNWPSGVEPREIAADACQVGIRRMIVLDLAAVGTGNGIATLELCREIREQFADMEIITGGGVRNLDDLQILQNAGIDGALISSALHNGGVTTGDLDRLVSATKYRMIKPRRLRVAGGHNQIENQESNE